MIKTDIQNSVVFLYIINEQSKNKIRKTITITKNM